MRYLALILPLCLVGLLLLVQEEKDEPVAAGEVPVAPANEEPLGDGHGMVWISHDWVETAPQTHRREAEIGFRQ